MLRETIQRRRRGGFSDHGQSKMVYQRDLGPVAAQAEGAILSEGDEEGVVGHAVSGRLVSAEMALSASACLTNSRASRRPAKSSADMVSLREGGQCQFVKGKAQPPIQKASA